jgi:TolB protein
MKRRHSLLLAAVILAIALPAAAQTNIGVTIDPNRATTVYRMAMPFPDLGPAVSADAINVALFEPLSRDVAYSGIFAIAPLPPNVPVTLDLVKRVEAHVLLKLKVTADGGEHLIDAELVDTTGARVYGQRFRVPTGAMTQTAHMIANALVRAMTGKPSIFMSRIAFASDRDGAWEIWLMDWDGSNQRRITSHRGLSILPSWSPDNERMVYTSFMGGASEMYIINRRGGGRIRVQTGLNLNTSATFSPTGNDIAFVGSVAGNPDIYVIRDDGKNLRRLTSAYSIESTPEWSPNGRQISFTSGRSGTPQIYVMDAEGSNVRRISFDGSWNDDATWSPDGDRIAFTSRVNGRFQIRIYTNSTGESRVVAGEGSNEQPSWSPDGQWIAFQSNRSGRWQVYRMRVDGTDLLQLTFDGENKEPDWSKKAE